MAWRWNDEYALTAENFSFTPSGGPVKLVLLGIVLPAVILYFGIRGWINQEAVWIAQEDDFEVTGNSAIGISIAYTGIGILCHIRWVWGLLGCARIFEIGTILAAIMILAGLAYGFYWELRV